MALSPFSRCQWLLFLLLCFALFSLSQVESKTIKPIKKAPGGPSVGQLSVADIDSKLQECPIVQALNEHKASTRPPGSSLTSRLFALLFPGSPAVNALLATLYISGPPNFLLALCPPTIDPSSLSMMVAFAVGGLLGDTIFHLLPEIFLGEDSPEQVRFVLVEPNRNLLLGVAILVGFMTFVAMDKGLRIATGGEGHDHGHGHGHAHVGGGVVSEAEGRATGNEALSKGDGEARARRTKGDGDYGDGVAVQEKSFASENENENKSPNPSIKLGGYLNLIADFTHNITDGLALSSSFYASPTLGATTTVAVFFHEIPHEVGDFALLIQSGFSSRAAMGAQFLTALGAFLGTVIGIVIQEFGRGSSPSSSGSGSSAAATMAAARGLDARKGLLNTSLGWGDLLLPFTAGTFLYVGTVAVIPELLETSKPAHKMVELRRAAMQGAAVAAGAGIMLFISWD